MERMTTWFAAIGLALALAAGGPAQVRYFHPEKYDRATTKDEAARVQWAAHQYIQCPTRRGTGTMKGTPCERYPDEAEKCPDCGRQEAREAVCHACAGTGSFLDPLEWALCPGCRGAGRVVCAFCPGSGILKLGDNAKRWSACVSCRGDGWFECMVCKGARKVPSAKLKPSLQEADSKELKEALETTDETLQAVTAFEPAAKNARKEVKELLKAIKTGEKVHPSLKEMPKLAKDLMKMAYASSQYQGQTEREAAALARMKDSVEFYLQHQKRILELALARAEANEALDGGK